MISPASPATDDISRERRLAAIAIIKALGIVHFGESDINKVLALLEAIPSAIPRFQDQNRLEWVCERLAQHSMYIKQYDHAHELPRGGFAFYTNSTLLGYGETIVDAIDAAMKAEAANVK